MAVAPKRIYRFDDFSLEAGDHRLRRGGEELSLQPKTFEMLLYLVEHPGRLVKKSELLDALWADTIVTEGALTRCIWEVRQALGDDAAHPAYVQTIPRLGYKFIAPVEEVIAVTEEEVVEEEEYTAIKLKVTDGREETPKPHKEVIELSQSCARCGADNFPAMEFCIMCGNTLAIGCPGCEFRNRPQAEFCGKCGTRLSQATSEAESMPVPEVERRQLTVLCSDVEMTFPGSSLPDPEQWQQVLQAYHDVCRKVASRFQGQMAKSLGNMLIVGFGYPKAREHDAQRAVCAGLGILQGVQPLRARLEKDQGITFAVRMGIDTGLVVTQDGSDEGRLDSLTLVGEPLTIAARLQELAEPDTLLISAATQRLIDGFFECQELGSPPLKGISRPIRVYEVRQEKGMRSRLEAMVETAGLTPLVGRQYELTKLPTVWEKAKQGQGQVVSVIGEAGIGKSRLMYEFKRRLEQEGICYLEGSCFAYGDRISYLPFLAIVRVLFGLSVDESEAEMKRKIEHCLGELKLETSTVAPYLHNLLSLRVEDEVFPRLTPDLIRQRTVESLKQVVLAQAIQKPLILIVEDVHWIDKATEEVLRALVEAMAETPLLLILIYRPEYLYGWAKAEQHWEIRLSQLPDESSAEMVRAILSKPYTSRLPLEPLTREQSKALAQELLGTTRIPPEVEELIVSKTEGNPLFVEELTRSLVERGDLVRVNGGYELARSIEAIHVPTTLQGVLLERIDRLSEDLKQVLRVASVIGRVFDYRLLSRVLEGRENLKRELQRLEELDFIRSSGPLWEKQYWFKHVLTQEAVYSTLLNKTRQKCHEQVGGALETLHPERLEEYYEVLAYHYTQSGNKDKAVEFLILSNQKAVKADAMQEAKSYFDQAMALLDTMPETEINQRRHIALMTDQIGMFTALQKQHERYEWLRQYEPMAVELGDSKLLAALYAHLGCSENVLGRYDQAMETLRKAADLCEQTGNDKEAAHVYCHWGSLHVWRGDYEIAFRLVDQALEKLEQEFHLRVMRETLGLRSLLYNWMGRWEEAVKDGETVLGLGEEYSNSGTVSIGSRILSIAYTYKGDLTRGVEYGKLAVEKAQAPAMRVEAQCALAWAWCRSGDPHKGCEILTRIIPLLRAAGSFEREVRNTVRLGEGYWLAGEDKQAKQTLEEVLRLAEGSGMKYYAGQTHRLLGEVNLKINPTLAAEHFEKSLAVSRTIKAENELALACVGYGRFFKQRGDYAKARTYLTQALEIFERLGTLIEPDKIRRELAEK